MELSLDQLGRLLENKRCAYCFDGGDDLYNCKMDANHFVLQLNPLNISLWASFPQVLLQAKSGAVEYWNDSFAIKRMERIYGFGLENVYKQSNVLERRTLTERNMRHKKQTG
jgi:hypothetical protein